VPLIWCHARASAAGFYAGYGWHPHGDVLTDADHPMPHPRMWRDLREPDAAPASS
jgi:hypothetical protein